MKYNKLTKKGLEALASSDLLILGAIHGVLRLEKFEVCFRGIRHPYLDRYPVKIDESLRTNIIEALASHVS